MASAQDAVRQARAAHTARVDTLLKRARVVFWDFDGVIKDSLTVKSDAFERLFLPYGSEIAARVRRHHEAHGGLSRFEKVPLYLDWAGEAPTPERVFEFCERFSTIVRQEVIDAPWVPGVREYLDANHLRQRFALVTATPQQEMQEILQALGIAHWFGEVHGAPTPKAAAMSLVLQRWSCQPEQSLAVGDADADFDAAEANHVTFALRRTRLNQELQERFAGPSFDRLGVGVTRG